ATAQDGRPPSLEPLPSQAVVVSVPPCRLAEHAGVAEADAATAAQLVCADLAHAGASSDARYRVSLGKLGSAIILSVAREGDSLGSTVDSREMRLQGIEEVSVAGPRIAESIVRGTPLKETEKVDNLVGDETRQPKNKPGKTHFAIGLLGMFPPLDHGLGPAAGGILDVHYETASFELGGSMRFGGGSFNDSSPKIAFFLAGVGGRYFLTETDASPYLGGGLAGGHLDLTLPTTASGGRFSGNNSGLSAYIEAGVQILRTNHAHLALGARLDLPFYALNNNSGYPGYSYPPPPNNPAGYGSAPANPGPNSIYYAPLSIEMRLTF
ncbi:MAG: hypothetical protein M3O36_07560, partial [Myxococcota bacterium]|nr:hypothetical protein [Myxococcota bacterium]